jgi:hypothetical protein
MRARPLWPGFFSLTKPARSLASRPVHYARYIIQNYFARKRNNPQNDKSGRDPRPVIPQNLRASVARAQLAVNRGPLARAVGRGPCAADRSQLAAGRGAWCAVPCACAAGRWPWAVVPGPWTVGRVPARIYALSRVSEHPPPKMAPCLGWRMPRPDFAQTVTI